MSPEQALGRRNSLDGRTDVYSLNAKDTLRVVDVRHSVPRANSTRSLATDNRGGAGPTTEDRSPSIPVELETIVLKAMAKAPAERYATAADLADDLGRFLDDRSPIRGSPTFDAFWTAPPSGRGGIGS